MLNIDLTNKSLVSKVYAKMVSDKGKVINFYDDVMFYGYNEKGDFLLCLCTEHNEDKGIGQYIEAVVDISTLKDFVKREVTCLDVFKKSPMIFITNTFIYKDIYKSHLITIDDLPKDFISHIDRHCPKLTKENYFSFLIKREIDK